MKKLRCGVAILLVLTLLTPIYITAINFDFDDIDAADFDEYNICERNCEYVDVEEETVQQNNLRRFYNFVREKITGKPPIGSGNPFVAVMEDENNEKREYIKWVDFKVTQTALEAAFNLDVGSYGDEVHLCWIELLAYLGAKYGGDFAKYRHKDLSAIVARLNDGETIGEITAKMKHYNYYLKAYTAVLSGFVGTHRVQVRNSAGDMEWQERYGLKAFHPLADGFGYSHYDDFGAGRNYGYRRKHLGHDMFGATGTPIIAVESGIVEELGWNRFGGWRVGIRSFCGERYHYYAHLRKNRPFHTDLVEVGQVIKAGDVIGYMGHTGYSNTENVNNIKETHLHYGLQLIFDPSQKEGNNQIWIDLLAITNFLEKNRSKVYRVTETKEFYRVFDFAEDCLDERDELVN